MRMVGKYRYPYDVCARYNRKLETIFFICILVLGRGNYWGDGTMQRFLFSGTLLPQAHPPHHHFCQGTYIYNCLFLMCPLVPQIFFSIIFLHFLPLPPLIGWLASQQAGLRIRSIFGRIRLRVLQIRILKLDPDPGSYWHLKNQFNHLNFFPIKHISSDIWMMIIFNWKNWKIHLNMCKT